MFDFEARVPLSQNSALAQINAITVIVLLDAI